MPMYFDEHGRPDPNGCHEKINGKLCLRDGHYVHHNIFMMDSAPPAPTTEQIRNAARDSRYTNDFAARSVADAAQAQASADRLNDWRTTEAIRNAARDSRYGS